MKTIEEKAIEYSKEVNGEYYNEPHPNCEYTLGEISENDYKSGYLEAQRWIPIDEELPSVDTEDEWNNEKGWSKQVIAKRDNYITVTAYNTKIREWHNSEEITHWRPVEIK